MHTVSTEMPEKQALENCLISVQQGNQPPSQAALL